jgi:hypothetical protein
MLQVICRFLPYYALFFAILYSSSMFVFWEYVCTRTSYYPQTEMCVCVWECMREGTPLEFVV